MAMGATQIIRDHEKPSSQAVRLLYVCDFPPSNFAGGPILLSRLLRDYPPDRITVLTSTRYARVSPQEGRLRCEEITVSVSKAWGSWGLGRLRALLTWLRIPLVAIAAWKIIRQREARAILTVLHGQFYFAAALAARLTGIPYVLVVHDDYTTNMNVVGRYVTGSIVRKAAHVYCVSPEMREMISSQFGVDSELQRPGTEPASANSKPARAQRNENPTIIYAGSITNAVEDSLRLLARLITSGKLKEYGVESAKLHLYTQVKAEQKQQWGWEHPDIVVHPWVSQDELPSVLSKADILFLPFSFSSNAKHTVETAFPSKTADYLASGRPILVLGPRYSSLVAYATREGFGEIVTEPSAGALARAIQRVALSASHAQVLSSRALDVFSLSHDIRQQRVQFTNMLNRIAATREQLREASRGI
jgi:glycosyltransferase involved in cell wall biosynthesis